jgi:hypothetical protein
MGTKNNPGKFDCYENANSDEPMFVLLARDPDAPILIRLWAAKRKIRGENIEKVEEAYKCADDMERWRELHRNEPEQCHHCGAPKS